MAGMTVKYQTDWLETLREGMRGLRAYRLLAIIRRPNNGCEVYLSMTGFRKMADRLRHWSIPALVLIAFCILPACNGNGAVPQEAQSAIPAPASMPTVAAVPIPTPTATRAPAPTATAVSVPTPTDIPAITPTAAPTPATPTVTAVPVNTPAVAAISERAPTPTPLLWSITTPVGLVEQEPEASAGYTLIDGGRVITSYIVDNNGQLVHTWDLETTTNPRLLENGNLLAKAGPTVFEADKDGNIVWEYTHPDRLHHDLRPMPNGNILLLSRKEKTAAEAIDAGANTDYITADDTVVRYDYIAELQPDRSEEGGKIVWEWHMWDHLVQDFDPGKSNYGAVAEHPELIDLNYTLASLAKREQSRIDLIHANAIDYNPELDQIMLSAHAFSELWIIDHSATAGQAAGHSGGNGGRGGDLLYRWGNPRAYGAGAKADQQLFWPHQTHWIPEGLPGAGNILVFNNGHEFGRQQRGYSSIVELAPPVDGYNYRLAPGRAYGPAEPEWTYTATPPADFYAPYRSGVQRLPNGNTLICIANKGTVLEVTPDGKTVWKYINPVLENGIILDQGDPMPYGAPYPRMPDVQRWNNWLYRAHRYPPDYPGLQGLDLTPKGTVEGRR